MNTHNTTDRRVYMWRSAKAGRTFTLVVSKDSAAIISSPVKKKKDILTDINTIWDYLEINDLKGRGG